MAEIVVLQHAAEDGPGYFEQFLGRQGASFRTVRIDQGQPPPADTAGIAGLVLMGGPQSVNDALAWIPKELDLIRAAVEQDIPVLGHCLGGQLLSKALGGQVGALSAKEIGWLPIRQLPGTTAASWLGELPQEFVVFQWHWESFTIPAGAERILESPDCPNQGFVIGKSLGLQCHIEMLPEMVAQWSRDHYSDTLPPTPSVQPPEEMLRDLEQRSTRLNRVADHIYGRWLREVG